MIAESSILRYIVIWSGFGVQNLGSKNLVKA